MHDDVNDLLERAGGWYVPDGDASLDAIVRIAASRRRRRRASAIGVSTVLTIGSLLLVIRSLSPETQPPPVASSTTTQTPTPSPALPAKPAHQDIGFHGLIVSVPASWTINDQHCGTPQSDTVIRDTGGVLACLVPRPKGISSLELFDDASGWLTKPSSTRSVTNPNGVRLERGSIPGQRGIVVIVPTVNVLMIVDTVSPDLTTGIIDSIRLADVDPNGCAMREAQLDPPTMSLPDPAAQTTMIAGAPSSIAICHYADNWLVSSAAVTGRQLRDFVELVNRLPDGWVHAPPSTYLPSACHEPATDGGEGGTGYIVWVSDGDGTRTQLSAHVGICGPLGITNGAKVGALTRGLAAALNEPLGSGYVMPGRLLPGRPE